MSKRGWVRPGDILRRESDELLRKMREERVCSWCHKRGCTSLHVEASEHDSPLMEGP